MNFRLLLCIAMGVFVTYLGVFMLIGQFRRKPYVPKPRPNFSAKATVVVNAETGEKTIYREITVSTKFAPAPATPPPSSPAPPQLDTTAEK
ncbi:MAG: hypothetical protein ABJF10_17770 [Chthoniobacter sp.]|uniref:hypothetical protein n=1 Tax=Chthoniobacter sp. TaxID=2510640 RepID=UPI0032AC25BA